MAEREPVEAHVEFQEAFNAGDLDRLMRLYEPDAVLVPQPGAAPVTGTRAIRAALEGFLALRGTAEMRTQHVTRHGDIALLRSTWHLAGRAPDGTPVTMSHASAEVVRRQAGGSWRYVIDHPFGAD